MNILNTIKGILGSTEGREKSSYAYDKMTVAQLVEENQELGRAIDSLRERRKEINAAIQSKG